MVWIILGITIVLIIIILFSRIYIDFSYTYQPKQQTLRIKLSLYHVRLFKRKISWSNKQPENVLRDLPTDNYLEKMRELQHALKSFRSIVHLLLNIIQINKLDWTTHAGTGDAATTGMAAGALWTIKGVLIGFVAEEGQLNCKSGIRIIPHYDRSCLYSQTDCMVSMRIGQAIHAFLTLNGKRDLLANAHKHNEGFRQ